MYRLFLNQNSIPLNQINTSQIKRIRELIFNHYNYQLKNFEVFGSYVGPDFILNKLIILLSKYLDDSSDIYKILFDNTHELCNALSITSATTIGKVHNNSFYTNTCLIISTNFGLIDYDIDWTNIRPVRCLTHPGTSMEVYSPATSKQDFINNGISAVGIDIPLFGHQLKAWYKYNIALPAIEQETFSTFISKYILPQMVPEQIDIALRNRISYIKEDIVPLNIEHERSFIKAYESVLVHPINSVLKNIENSRSSYINSLNQIPFIFTESYLDAVPIEIGELSNYSYWTTCLIMLEWAYPLLKIVKPDQKNNTNISKILLQVYRYANSTKCLNHMPVEFKEKFKEKFSEIVEYFYDGKNIIVDEMF